VDSIFAIVAITGLIAGGIAARMIWTARKPAPAAACCADAPPEGEAAPIEKREPWRRRLLDAIDYLRTRREWRYKAPWVVMLGERGAGKTSLLASLDDMHRQAADGREREIGVAPEKWLAKWHFLRGGVLIDVDGLLPTARAGSTNAKKWERLLDKIDALRPERALDGVMLTVSARTLLEAGGDKRRELAEDIYRQLCAVRDRFEFALPVYVVVTGADAVPGFAEFWRTRPERRPEMFGWSMPSQAESGTPEQWAEQMFDDLGARLKALQIAEAARKGSIADVDKFFLFPRHFQELRAPLKDWLSVVFQANAWRSGFLCRGVYFTGCIDPGAARTGEACKEVFFVDDLVTKKVLAEPGLANPDRQGHLSRNKLIRGLQMAGMAMFVGGLVWLAIDAWRLHRQIAILSDSIEAVRQTRTLPESGERCLPKDRIYELTTQISRINGDLRYWSMPVSFIVPKASGMGSDVIANQALQRVILPDVVCRLGLKAHELASHDSRLTAGQRANGVRAGAEAYGQARRLMVGHLQAIHALETNLARLKLISNQVPENARDKLLPEFIGLLEYAYGGALPPDVRNERGALSKALAKVDYEGRPALPAGMRGRFEKQLTAIANVLHDTLNRETAVGERLLKELSQDSTPASDSVRHFANWLIWVRSSWFGSTHLNNPCEEIRNELRPHINQLIKHHHYPDSLEGVPRRFDAGSCYRPLMQSLMEMRLAPEDRMFVRKNDALDVNPKLIPEMKGMATLVSLDFMQAPSAEAFLCQPAAAGWRTEQLFQASNYMREYQSFARNQGLPSVGVDPARQPLYDKLARRQLLTVLNSVMRQAQVLPSSGSPLQRASLDPTALADQHLAQESADFSKSVEPMLAVLRMFRQAGFSDEIKPIEQCVRNYAAANLGRIDQLAGASRLYEPGTDAVDGGFFDLGPLPVTKDYLARQVARSQVLTGYAAPFLALLKNTEPGDDAQRPNAQTAAYWSSGIIELARYTQAQDQNGQVAHLHNLFLKTFSGLNSANCAKTLAAYQPADPGNDLFSQRRRELEDRVRWRCSDKGRAQAYEAYHELAARFGRELQGRYPFAALSAPDAQPATVRSFFADYEAQRAMLHQLLDGLKGSQWNDMRRFIGQLDAASDFFRDNLLAGDTGQPVKLAVTFRALAKESPGSEQIVSWSITSGARSIGYPNRIGPLDWYIGQPLVLDLTWANRSIWRPVDDRHQSHLQTHGASASFSAAGEWALLRLIDMHRAKTAQADDGGLDPARVLLEFSVPVAPADSPAGKAPTGWMRAYLALGLSGKDAKTQAPAAVRLPPRFPHFAPPLPRHSN